MNVKKTNVLVIFAKYPEPGKVKTRLSKDIGEELACDLYKRFLHDIIQIHKNANYELVLSIAPPERLEDMKAIFGDLTIIPQRGEDLGERMYNAIADVGKGFEKVVLIGSDIPDLGQETINEAFEVLGEKDVVLGPAYDGGYYLIGMKRPHPVFSGITWSTSSVFGTTMTKILSLGLSHYVLEKKHDVDELEDLKRLKDKSIKYREWYETYVNKDEL